MIITFNAMVCGLGNNGGSRTIFKSAEILIKLGHIVYVSALVDNFTWFKHMPCRSGISPDSDAVVAVSALDVGHTLQCAPDRAHKAWWMRGWESWQSRNVIDLARKIHVICNSSWMVNELSKHGIKADLCFSGLDF